MTENAPATGSPPATAPAIDPAQLQYALQLLRSEQNLVLGALAGLVASGVGGALWAGLTLASGYQIGWMAVGVGFLVGVAVRTLGRGIDTSFGVLGAIFSLLGCAAGNLLAMCGLIAQQESMGYLDLLSRLDVELIEQIMVATFNPMDALFYAIAVYQGYKLSFRRLTQQEIASVLPGAA